jgi:hypothetical protein
MDRLLIIKCIGVNRNMHVYIHRERMDTYSLLTLTFQLFYALPASLSYKGERENILSAMNILIRVHTHTRIYIYIYYLLTNSGKEGQRFLAWRFKGHKEIFERYFTL